MQTQEQLVGQIGELQSAVSEMKTAFTSALDHLASLSAGSRLGAVPPPTGTGTSTNSGPAELENLQQEDPDVLTAVRQLQEELGGVSASIRGLQEGQEDTRERLQQLLDERDLLLDELCRSGSVSEQTRRQLYHRFPSRTSSGCHSNDSGLGAAQEKMGWFGPSDQESGSLTDGPLVSTMVQDYVNGLSRGGDSYESDSSISLAVTKSFTLSSTLSKRCGLELEELSALEAQARSEDSSPLEPVRPADSPDLNADREPDSDSEQEAERVKVARELADTERRYCSTLWTIQDTFAEPLSAASLLSAAEQSTLFPEVTHQLYEKHCRLLHALEERLGAWHWQPHIGDLLSKFVSSGDSEVLQMYASYVNGFPDLLKTFYRLCRTSEKFDEFLKTQQHHPSCRGLDLAALLLSPVQRVPRYVLLLQQLLRHTPLQHGDHAPLQRVLQQLRTFLDTLNGSLEHSFQLVAVHVNARELDARLSKPPRRRSRTDLLWSEAGDLATLRRRCKQKPGSTTELRPASSVHRSGSASSGELPDYAASSATVAKKTRRSQEGKTLYDCKSLPHIKQRRRSQLQAARSETTLRAPDPTSGPLRRSALNLPAEPSTDVKQRLQFDKLDTDVTPEAVDPASPLRSLPPPSPVKVSGSQTLPRGRRLTVTRDGRCVTPEQRHPSADPPQRGDKRRVAIRTFKNMFSLKKRVSRSGTLSITDSSRDGGVCTDQYTPLREPVAPCATEAAFRSTQ